MATYNGDSYVDFRNINLRGGASGTGLIRWDPAGIYGSNGGLWGANPFGTTDYGLYINSAGALVFSSAGTITTLGAAGAASNPTWNTVWGAAQRLQLAGVSTFTIDNNTGNNNVLTLTNTGTGSGVLLQITNAGTGSDIAGTSASWTISKAGDMTAKSMVFAGTAGTTSLTMTLGDIITSAGGLALTKAANNATLTVTNNTSTSASAIVFVGSGTYTGNTTSSWFTMTPSGLTTGTAVYIATVALTTGKALQLNYAGTTSQTTGIQAQILNSSTAMQATARIFSVSHTGISSASGAGILSEFISAAADATTVVKVTASSTLTGSALWISAGSVAAGTGLLMTLTGITTGKGIDMGTLTGLTTGQGLIMAHTTSTIADGGSMVRLSSTAANTGGATNGTMLDVQTTAQVDGTQVLIKGAAVTTGVLLSLSTTTGMTSGSVIRATTTTAGAIATNGVFSFNASGAFTNGAATVGAFHVAGAATVTGTIMSILGGAHTTGIALNITDPSAGMTTGSLLRVVSATTGAVATNGVVSFQLSGAYTSTAATLGAVHVSAVSTVTGTAFSILTGSMTSGVGAYISDGAGTGLTSGSLLRIATATTGAVATSGVVALVASGNYTSTAFVGLLTLVANSTTAGTIASIFGTGLTTGVAAYISGTGTYTGIGFVTVNATGTTTGNIVRINATAATLTTGRYLSAYDGANEVFGIGANGHVHTTQGTAPTIAVTQQNGITAAAITAGSSDMAGNITTTGTNNNSGTTILTVTFHKTYTAAPKVVLLQPVNASGGLIFPYLGTINATSFQVIVPASASSGATPAWCYQVIG